MALTPTSMEVLKARLTLALRMRRSPTRTGATKSRWSMEAVTMMARAWRLAAMAPTRSMNCMRRPPKRLPRALVSPGKMISLRSDWEAQTVLELVQSDILPL